METVLYRNYIDTLMYVVSIMCIQNVCERNKHPNHEYNTNDKRIKYTIAT